MANARLTSAVIENIEYAFQDSVARIGATQNETRLNNATAQYENMMTNIQDMLDGSQMWLEETAEILQRMPTITQGQINEMQNIYNNTMGSINNIENLLGDIYDTEVELGWDV